MKMNAGRLFLNFEEYYQVSLKTEALAKWLWPSDEAKQAAFINFVVGEIIIRLEIEE